MGDATELLANMDKGQLKSMLSSLKENPEMLQQFAGMSGMNPEQLQKGIDMFANLDDDKFEAAIKLIGKAQQAKQVWTKVDQKTGGHLIKLCVLGVVLLGYFFLSWVIFRRGGGDTAGMQKMIPPDPIPDPVEEMQDEFDL